MTVADEVVGSIAHGLLVLLGVEQGDTEADADWLLEKILNLRIFADDAGKMNLSLLDCGGGLLVVSQFTLVGDCRKGRRPSFTGAAAPAEANRLYELFVGGARTAGIQTETGVFQADMDVKLTNYGPVTFLLDSKKTF